jgi:hypothetical protein
MQSLTRCGLALFFGSALTPCSPAADVIPPFHPGVFPGEKVREWWVEPGIRVQVNAPARPDPARSTRLVIYATPNGNTIEQTLGCAKADGLDWHFDIQHVTAQIRKLRDLKPGENVVLAVVEAEGLSWPAWRAKHKDHAARIKDLVELLREQAGGNDVRVAFTGHSGGGSFLTGFLNAHDAIPAYVDHVSYLDSNYSYSDPEKHGDKLIAWLKGDAARSLAVIAYDDREITLDGKKVVGPDGGTFRATGRMTARFEKDIPLTESKSGDVVTRTGLDGRVTFHVHTNPQNNILHTALVGEMNGLLAVFGAAPLGGPRTYEKYVQTAPGIPPRPKDAVGGKAFFARIDKLSRPEREEAIAAELLRGNLPEFLRTFVPVTVKDGNRTATIDVMPDYLAVGSDADWVRVPMNPYTAQRVADAFGCQLPTRKIADAVAKAAGVKLVPLPLSIDREAPATFAKHHALIEAQRTGEPLGKLVGGVKKDVVVTNRLADRPDRVAIFGWHYPDGTPIQPLTTVHVDWYVDYSHGVRLVKRTVLVDGKPRDGRHVLHAAETAGLLSDEGPLTRPSY